MNERSLFSSIPPQHLTRVIIIPIYTLNLFPPATDSTYTHSAAIDYRLQWQNNRRKLLTVNEDVYINFATIQCRSHCSSKRIKYPCTGSVFWPKLLSYLAFLFDISSLVEGSHKMVLQIEISPCPLFLKWGLFFS